ncbi:hypothetical protein Pla110_30610 [Polystyrenella longa]|uniref:Uncharacterized protein n=1 Tax=Polystyrenella longa TaxID=2528007 RepID=A0A518CQ19_9PLAN|nr:response regulator [Polystyrenella longa]QDU81320.1 hypothetical protein Pla110_30610 [Polystyrenella longa]
MGANNEITQVSPGHLGSWTEGAHLLCYALDRPHWMNLTLQLDSRGCHSPRLEWVSTESELIELVHEHEFDVIILACQRLDHFDSQIGHLLQTIRTSGNHDPILLLSEQIQPRELSRCFEADVEFLHSSLFWDAPALVAALERARRLHRQREDYLAWGRERQQRLMQEQKESERILEQQRKMLDDLRSLTNPLASEFQDDNEALESTPLQSLSVPSKTVDLQSADQRKEEQTVLRRDLKRFYSTLLRSYVVMGTGSLTEEIKQVVFQLEVCGLSIRETMSLHLEQVEELVRGLGNRSSRHVMSRADMLILEMLMHLAEERKGKQGETGR